MFSVNFLIRSRFALLTAVFLLFPSAVFAHSGIWIARYKNWVDGIEWGIIGIAGAVIVAGLLLIYASQRRHATVDLLKFAGFSAFIKSSLYPLIFQIPTLIVFAVIIYYLFFGSYFYSENPGSIFSWTLWWAVLPFSFILVGRLWCAVCPFAWVSDIVQKYFGRRARVPVWLAKYSFWIVDFTFLFVTWFDRVYGMTERPFLTGLVMAALLLGAAICGFFYERRVFCRYVCFLGNVAGTYSMAAPIEFAPRDPQVCAQCKEKSCFFGREGKPGCPLYQVMPSKEGNRFCTMCASCVKACPYDNIAIKLRPWGADFWRRIYVRFEESFFAKMLVGIVIMQNIGMLTLWDALRDFVSNITGITGGKAIFTIVFLLTVSIPLLLMFGASAISARAGKEKIIQNFARFGYAFVAVDLAGHLAHNLNHFFGEGKTILAAVSGIFSGAVPQILMQWFLNYGTMRIFQYIILTIGAVSTVFITYRIAKRTAQSRSALVVSMLPHLVLLLALMALNFYIFSLPMSHRSQNIL